MTDAVKRHLLNAEKNFGGAWCLPRFHGLRSINTAIVMGQNGLAMQNPNWGWILTPKGIAARERLLKAGSVQP